MKAKEIQEIITETQENIRNTLTLCQNGFTLDPSDDFPITEQEIKNIINPLKKLASQGHITVEEHNKSQFYKYIKTYLFENFVEGTEEPIYRYAQKFQGHPSHSFYLEGKKVFSCTIGENPRSEEPYLRSVTLNLAENLFQTTLLSFNGEIYKTFPPVTIGGA